MARTTNGSPKSPASGRGRPARGEDPSGRDRLLAAGRDIFGRKGFAAASVEELVKAAGVTPPTLYFHFTNKAGLFVEVTQRAYSDVLTELRAAVSDDMNFGDSVDALVRAGLVIFRRDQALPEMIQVIQFEHRRSPELADPVLPILREYRAFFDQVTAKAPASVAATPDQRRQLSRVMVAILAGLSSEALLLTSTADLEGLFERTRALLNYQGN